MLTTSCRNLHTGPGQLGLTVARTITSNVSLTPGVLFPDYYHNYVLTLSGPFQVSLPSGTSFGFSAEIHNVNSSFDLEVTDGLSSWTVPSGLSAMFVNQGASWARFVCSTFRQLLFRDIKISFGYSKESFSRDIRGAATDLDPSQITLLNTADPNSVGDSENYAYYHLTGTEVLGSGSLCHFNFRTKRGGVYLGDPAFSDPANASFTFVLRINFPWPAAATLFSSIGYCYSAFAPTIDGDVDTDPRSILGVIVPDTSDRSSCFVFYVHRGQRMLLGDMFLRSTDYTYFGSGTYVLA